MKDSKFYLINEQFDNISQVLLGEYWDDIRLRKKSTSVQSALQGSPRTVDKDNYAKHREYFGHIIIYLSAEIIENDRRAQRGRGVEHLKDIFEGVHREHFSALTSAVTGVRYQVLPSDLLSDHQVRIAFGRCVYLPSEQEKPLYQLDFSMDESEKLSLLFYKNQRLAMVNANPYGAQVAFTDWPFTGDASILVLQADSGELEVLSEPYNALSIVKGESDNHYCISDEEGNSVDLEVSKLAVIHESVNSAVKGDNPDGDEDRVQALLDRMGTSTVLNDDLDDRTFLSGGASNSSLLSVVGIALQRLSKFKRYGFEQLRVGFSKGGEIIDPDDASVFGVLVQHADDSLYIEQDGASELITLPYSWRISADIVIEIEKPDSQYANAYVACFNLVSFSSFNLFEGEGQIFGRGESAQIAPNLLQFAQVILADTERPIESLERLGFSSNTAEFKVVGEGMQVLPSNKNSFWHLNQDKEVIETINEESKLIRTGEFLVAGHYLLRFDG